MRGWPGSLENVSCSRATPDLHRCNLEVALEQETFSGLPGHPCKRLLAPSPIDLGAIQSFVGYTRKGSRVASLVLRSCGGGTEPKKPLNPGNTKKLRKKYKIPDPRSPPENSKKIPKNNGKRHFFGHFCIFFGNFFVFSGGDLGSGIL